MYRIVADTAADMILCVNQDNEIIYANPSTLHLVGHKPASLIGKKLTALIPEAHQPDHIAGFERFLQTEVPSIRWSGVELTIVHKDGTEIPVEVSFGAVKGEDGQYRFTGFVRDSRPRKKLENESRERLAALTHANRLKSVGQLAAGLAHELNQPLSALCLHADFVLDSFTELDKRTQVSESLEAIVGQAERASRIIKVLREMIHETEITRAPVDLNRAVLAISQLMRAEVVAHNIRLELKLNEGRLFVLADVTHIEQVILNLVQNAVDAIQMRPQTEGKITIVTRPQGSMLIVEVIDSGVGLPPGNDSQVFNNFFTTKANGLGIGLGICQSIATMHHGQIVASNVDPQGACFSLSLPRFEHPSGELR